MPFFLHVEESEQVEPEPSAANSGGLLLGLGQASLVVDPAYLIAHADQDDPAVREQVCIERDAVIRLCSIA
jgi:hypothetical protein